jgi:hypothetical protein
MHTNPAPPVNPPPHTNPVKPPPMHNNPGPVNPPPQTNPVIPPPMHNNPGPVNPPPARIEPPPLVQPPPPPRQPQQSLFKTRGEIVDLLRNNCFTCHNSRLRSGGFSMGTFALQINRIFVSRLKNLQLTKGLAMDRMVARVNDQDNPMPPDGPYPDIAAKITAWANQEMGR